MASLSLGWIFLCMLLTVIQAYPCGRQGVCQCLYETINCKQSELRQIPHFSWEATRRATTLDLTQNDGLEMELNDLAAFVNLEVVRAGKDK